MTFTDDTRADSNTVGFILIISIFLIGGLGMFGVAISVFDNTGETPGERAVQQLNNVRSTFQEFTDGSPYRQATVSLSDASLSYGQPVTIDVDVTDQGGGTSSSGTPVDSVETAPITYSYDGGEVRYVNGVVVLEQDNGGAVVRTTGTWRIGDFSRFPILAINPQAPGDSVGASGGSHTVYVNGYASRPLVSSWDGESQDDSDPDNYEVTVTYSDLKNSKSADAWESHLRSIDSINTVNRPSPREVSFTFVTDRIIVREIPVETGFSR